MFARPAALHLVVVEELAYGLIPDIRAYAEVVGPAAFNAFLADDAIAAGDAYAVDAGLLEFAEITDKEVAEVRAPASELSSERGREPVLPHVDDLEGLRAAHSVHNNVLAAIRVKADVVDQHLGEVTPAAVWHLLSCPPEECYPKFLQGFISPRRPGILVA